MSQYANLNGQKIREFREANSLSQSALIETAIARVRESGDLPTVKWMENRITEDRPFPISTVALSNIENGKVTPRRMTARFIAIGMGVELNDILQDEPDLEEEGHRFPMPVMLTGSTVYEGPDEQGSVELDEIIAIRLFDGDTAVLGYGVIDQDVLYQLLGSWVGGGFEALMDWAGVDRPSGFLFDPDMRLLIGPEEGPVLMVGRSGSRVRIDFRTGRNNEATGVAQYSRWNRSEDSKQVRYWR